MPVFVNNLQEKVKVDNRLLDTLNYVVETALRVEGRIGEGPEVSIALVDDNCIRDLNHRFRKVDKPTDVLSFPMEESEDEPPVNGEENSILGDIVISLETAVRQAEEYGHAFVREMAYLATHGMFHLLGYDHDNEANRRVMREREEKVLAILNIPR